jgi:hypothetical protein
MTGVGPTHTYRDLFKKLGVLPIPCVYMLSLMTLVVNNVMCYLVTYLCLLGNATNNLMWVSDSAIIYLTHSCPHLKVLSITPVMSSWLFFSTVTVLSEASADLLSDCKNPTLLFKGWKLTANAQLTAVNARLQLNLLKKSESHCDW